MKEKRLEFIEKAKKIHGDKYDYSLTDYTQSKNKIDIICKEHGIFKQRANGHLKGYGCKKCSYLKQSINKKNFIERSKEIQGNKYDYSKVEYVNFDIKVKITCPIHGDFEQSPNNHLKGSGCKKCSFIKRRTGILKFIEKSNIIHNNKYDYSKVEYITSHIKINIICPKHGEFKQTPHGHLKGQGCSICKESIGEKKIRNVLIDNNINFIYQKKFFDCKNIKQLPFDFYLPDYNLCIEFNGIQHYKSIDFFGGKHGLECIKKTDKIKKEYCKNKEIRLIIIKYNESINKLLNKIFKNEKN